MEIPSIDDSPLTGLVGPILRTFEKAVDVSTLSKAVNQGAIDSAIHFEQSAKLPHAYSPTGLAPWSMRVGVAYLEGLWAYSCGLLLWQENQMRLAAQEWKQRLPSNGLEFNQSLEHAEQLIVWACSLPTAYTRWPLALPSPDLRTLPKDYRDLAEKTATIFRVAVAWLLHHEFAHAQYRHGVHGIPESERLEQEKDADIVAYSRFFDDSSSEGDRRLMGWSILVPHLYALAAAPSPASLFADRHLHVHHRLAHALAHLNFRDPHNQDYFGALCADAVRTFYIKNDINPRLGSGPKFPRVNDYFQYLVDGLDAFDPDRS